MRAFVLDDRARVAACGDDPKFFIRICHGGCELVCARRDAASDEPALVVLRNPNIRQLYQLALDLCIQASMMEGWDD